MKILFATEDPKAERWKAPLLEQLSQADIHIWDAANPITDADYAIVWQPPAEVFAQAHSLKAIFNLGAGVDALLKLPGLPAELPIYRLEDAGMSAQMAEYVAYHVIEASRDMALYREQQADGVWKMLRPIRRQDWPIGVLGLGQIGKRVATTLAGLDYPVAGWSRSGQPIEGVEPFAGQTQLKSFLGRTRVLINTLPLTPDTRDLLNYDTLSSLLPDAVVINVGRGEHLVDHDLIRAIDEGLIRQAVLDVFRQEPLPIEHPFWRHPSITLTPHVSARTLRDETVQQICDKIKLLESGKSPSGLIDRQRGY